MRLLFVFLISFCCNSFAQTVKLTVLDPSGEPAYGARIYINNNIEGTVGTVVFIADVNRTDTILVKSYDYEDLEYFISPINFKEDTLRIILTLSYDFQRLEEVIVSAKQIETVYNEKDHFIIDYYPDENRCLYLIKNKNDYFIQLTNFNKVVTRKKLSFKPESIFLDAMENYHIISVDSSYQLWFDSNGINWLPPASIDLFNSQLLPIKAKSDISYFAEFFVDNNKKYKVRKYAKDSIIDIYESFDKKGYLNDINQEQKIISMYYSAVPIYSNIIENGLWDGNLMYLAENKEILQELGWYRAVLDYKIPCFSFGGEDVLTIIDFLKDSVHIVSYHNEGDYSFPLDKKLEEKAYYDYFGDKIYLIGKEDEKQKIYELDVNSKVLKRLKEVEGISFARNIRFSGNWVYFTVMEKSGFNKVVRHLIR